MRWIWGSIELGIIYCHFIKNAWGRWEHLTSPSLVHICEIILNCCLSWIQRKKISAVGCIQTCPLPNLEAVPGLPPARLSLSASGPQLACGGHLHSGLLWPAHTAFGVDQKGPGSKGGLGLFRGPQTDHRVGLHHFLPVLLPSILWTVGTMHRARQGMRMTHIHRAASFRLLWSCPFLATASVSFSKSSSLGKENLIGFTWIPVVQVYFFLLSEVSGYFYPLDIWIVLPVLRFY